MIDFYLLTDRVNDNSKKKIREHIFNDGEVNYDFIIPFLENLEVELCISGIIKKPIYSELYNSYTKQKDINKLIEDTNLYASQFINLVDLGIIKQNYLDPEHLEPDVDIFIPPLEITIINAKEFKKLKRRTFKDFAFIVLVLKRRTFLISLFDEISKMGPFNEAEIFKLNERFQAKQKKLEELIKPYLEPEINEEKFENKINKENEKPIHKTFYLDIVRSQPSILKKDNEFLEAFHLLKNNSLISIDTTVDKFHAIFQSKSLKEENFIQWTGTLIELKWLIQQICIKGICSHIIGIEKWKVAQNCFLIKVDGKWSKIEKYTQISNANGVTINKEYIVAFGKKIKSFKKLHSESQ